MNELDKEFIIKTVQEYNKGFGFTNREVIDSPTDALQVVNRQYVDGKVITLIDGATVSLNASSGGVFDLTAAGDRTIAVPSFAKVYNKKIIIRHKASGADRTLTLTTGSAGAFRFGSDFTALSATVSAKTDYIGCIYNKADARWDVVAVTKGFG